MKQNTKYMTESEVLGNRNEELMKCPECKEQTLIYDEERDEYICDTCGLLIRGNYFDENY